MAKLLSKVRGNPRGNWTIANVQTLCAQEGLICTAPTGGGSHWKISHSLVGDILTVPAHRPIKPVYMRALVRMIDAARLAEAIEAKKRKDKK